MCIAAEKGCKSEYQDGSKEIILSSKFISQPARHRQYDYVCHGVTGYHPSGIFQCGTKITHDIGKRHINDGRIN